MRRERIWLSVVYGIALIVIGLSTFRSAYTTLKPFVVGGSGHKVGWILATQFGVVATLILIVILARLVNIVRSKGLVFVAPQGGASQFLRLVSLILLVVCVIYKVLAYGIALGIPFGAFALMIDHLFPITVALIMFEASRVFALEQTVLSPNPTLQPTPESRRG